MGIRCCHGWKKPGPSRERPGCPSGPACPGFSRRFSRERTPSERIDCGSLANRDDFRNQRERRPVRGRGERARRGARGRRCADQSSRAPERRRRGPTTRRRPSGIDRGSRRREGRRSFFAWLVALRSFVIPLACVAAFLVGFGSMWPSSGLGDGPARPDTKTVPTMASPSLPAITTPRPARHAPRPQRTDGAGTRAGCRPRRQRPHRAPPGRNIRAAAAVIIATDCSHYYTDHYTDHDRGG